MNKAIKKIAVILISFLVICCIFWFCLNFFLIPKIVIPFLKDYLGKNLSSGIKVEFSDLSFHPFKGFLMHNLRVSGPVVLKARNDIISSKLADIDVAFLPLLRMMVDIQQFTLYGADFNIGRDENGIWNFQPILDEISAPDSAKFTFILKNFNMKNARMHYMDCYSKHNALERHFSEANISIMNVRGGCYEITASGRSKDERGGSAKFYVYYDSNKKSASGNVKLDTKRLTEYWDYYLDDIFKPWHLKAKRVIIDTQFSYSEGRLSLNGMYSVDDGILSYGDLSVKCDMDVNHNVKYVKDSPRESITRIKASIKDIASSTGEYVFLENAKCTAYITDREIFVRNLTGSILKQPVSLGGIFFFGPRVLHAHGKFASIDNNIYMKVLSLDKGSIGWKAGLGNSRIKAKADVSSLKNMDFNSIYNGNVKLEDVRNLFKCLNKTALAGYVSFTGKLNGEVDKPSSLNGTAELKAKDFSILGIQPISFDFKADIKEGLLTGSMPKTNLHKGDLYGFVKADIKRWAAELHIDKLDLAEFFKSELEIEDAKGVFNMSLACACNWKDIKSLEGGGFVKIENCDMRKTPIFHTAEEGIQGVSRGFTMPSFTKIAANYDIADNCISSDKITCESLSMNLNINGTYDFNGDLDCNIGVRFLSKGLLGTARMVLMPETLGFDLLASTINVKITGKWPGTLKQETQIQPIAWMTNLFDPKARPDPDKYTLDKVWIPG